MQLRVYNVSLLCWSSFFNHNISQLRSDQEKILALLASWSFHRKPTAKSGNIYIEKVLYITKNRL